MQTSPEPQREVWYRIDARSEASWDDEREEFYNRRVLLNLHELPVLSHTPKGVWLYDYGRKRFVRRDTRKRYACPTREEALESFKKRKERHAGILRSQLHEVETVLKLADRITPEKLQKSTYTLASSAALDFALEVLT